MDTANEISEREKATMIAALRFWQKEGVIGNHAGRIKDIAEGFGSFEPLDGPEIDELVRKVQIGLTVSPQTTNQ